MPPERVADLPRVHAGLTLQALELSADVHEPQRAFGPFQQRRDDGLVLQGIQRARAVDQPAPNLQEPRRVRRDVELQRVKVHARRRRPLLPQVRRFSQGAVAGARDVREDAIEPVRLARRVAFAALWVEQRELLRLVIGHDERGRVAPFGLVRQQVGALQRRVVGHHHAGGHPVSRVVGEIRGGGARVEHLEELERLRAGRRAHVQDAVVRLHVQQQGRDHRDRFLPGDRAHFVGADQELAQPAQVFAALQPVFGDVDLPRQAVRVPTQALRGLHLGVVLDDGGEQLVHEPAPGALAELAAHVHAERQRQRRAERRHHRLPLLRRDHALRLVVRVELVVTQLRHLALVERVVVREAVVRLAELVVRELALALLGTAAAAAAADATSGVATAATARERTSAATSASAAPAASAAAAADEHGACHAVRRESRAITTGSVPARVGARARLPMKSPSGAPVRNARRGFRRRKNGDVTHHLGSRATFHGSRQTFAHGDRNGDVGDAARRPSPARRRPKRGRAPRPAGRIAPPGASRDEVLRFG